jgi:hypothetical protein
MEQMFREAIEGEAVRRMAAALLESEKKELKEITKFSLPDRHMPVPAGVYPFSPGRYSLLTPDGLVEIRAGDYILETLDHTFYYIRLEITE